MTIDELLAQVRGRIDGVHPAEVPARVAAGALLVDTSPDRLPEVTGYDLDVVILCNEGYSSSLVADTLRTLGLTRSVDVIGGFVAWAAAGLPVVPLVGRDAAA